MPLPYGTMSMYGLEKTRTVRAPFEAILIHLLLHLTITKFPSPSTCMDSELRNHFGKFRTGSDGLQDIEGVAASPCHAVVFESFLGAPFPSWPPAGPPEP